jgi:hypothetical protein
MATAKSKKKPSRKAPPSGKGLTFEKVWASLQETREIMQKNDKKQEKRHKELEQIIRENAEFLTEFQKETDRIVRRNSKQMGDLHRRFGQLAEHLVAPGITKRFNEIGYHFDLVATKGAKLYDEHGKVKAEIDLLLENGKTRILVEVKSRPVAQDIEHHIKRLELFSDKWRLLNEPKKILGAIAGAIYEDDVKEAVREAGMYVIEQSGDTMKIDMPDDFIPREW